MLRMNLFRGSPLSKQQSSLAPTTAAPMPVIIGVPRSGTTLLHFMLDAHPTLAIPPETGFLARPLSWLRVLPAREALFRTVTRLPFKSGAWQDFGLDAREFREELRKIEPFSLSEGFRAFYRLYARKQNKLRYGDKTPLYCEHVAAIEKLLPEAHFIHIIRDGRDVALSLRPMPFAPAQDMKTLALYWRRLIQNGRQSGRHCRAYMEIRYEQLVRDPASVLVPICGFLHLDFDPVMLRYWERVAERLKEHGSRSRLDGRLLLTREQRLFQQRLTTEPPQLERVSGWKKAMSRAERAEFNQFVRDTLQELGYEP
jgi:hypothetical protein